jgi:hypothetical protein
MHVLANTMTALLEDNGSVRLVPTEKLALFIREPFGCAPIRVTVGDEEVDHSFNGKLEAEGWRSTGVLKLVDTRSGVACRIRYHGPCLSDMGEIRLAGALSWHLSREEHGKLPVGTIAQPYEMEIYQLDPDKQRIYLMNADGSDGTLVWPEEGKDYTPRGYLVAKDPVAK